MIDTLIKFIPLSSKATYPFEMPKEYGLVTLHRPSNVDDEKTLNNILKTLESISEDLPIIFPIHPRTKSKISKEFLCKQSNIILSDPLGYIQFLNLQKNAKFVVTDSGGIQEETTYLKVPCFTFRENTERPVTIDVGSNILSGTNAENLYSHIKDFLAGKSKNSSIPEFWDGKASIRIAKAIDKIFQKEVELSAVIA